MMMHMTDTPYEFDKQSFLNALQTVPHHIIIEMAEDGVICDREVAQLLARLGMQQEHIEAMRAHFHLIARAVMRHAVRHLGVKPQKGICQLTGEQAVQIMQDLLNRGFIDRYYTHVIAPSTPAMVPELAFTKKKDALGR
jgi:hypothetical protein